MPNPITGADFERIMETAKDEQVEYLKARNFDVESLIAAGHSLAEAGFEASGNPIQTGAFCFMVAIESTLRVLEDMRGGRVS